MSTPLSVGTPSPPRVCACVASACVCRLSATRVRDQTPPHVRAQLSLTAAVRLFFNVSLSSDNRRAVCPFQWLLRLTVEMGIIVQKRFSVTTTREKKKFRQSHSWSSSGPKPCYCQQSKIFCPTKRFSGPDSSEPMNLQCLPEMK